MEKTNAKYSAYIQILKERKPRPAMGCTEPIALAYAGCQGARRVLGALPERVHVAAAAGSIIKNVKAVIVPTTGHMKGIPRPAAAAGGCGQATRTRSWRFSPP